MAVPMNVLLLGGTLHLDDHGLYLAALARGLQSRGHQVTLLAPDGPLGTPLVGEPPRDHHLQGILWRDLLEHLRLKRELRELAPHLLHVAGAAWDLSGRVLARLLGVPRVLSLLSAPAPEAGPRSSPPEVVLDHRPAGSVPAALLLDAELRPAPTQRHRLSVGTVGPLLRQRRLKVLLGALAEVAPRRPGALFPIIGEGPYLRFLVRRARERGIRDHLVVCEPGGSPLRVLEALDLLVFPGGPGESHLLPLLALAAERPVLVAADGPAAPLLRDLAPSWVLPPADAAALAERILVITGDPEPARQEARRVGSALRQRLGKEPWLAGLEAAYLRAVGASPAPSAG